MIFLIELWEEGDKDDYFTRIVRPIVSINWLASQSFFELLWVTPKPLPKTNHGLFQSARLHTVPQDLVLHQKKSV